METSDPFAGFNPDCPRIKENWEMLFGALTLAEGFSLHLLGCSKSIHGLLLKLIQAELTGMGKSPNVHHLRLDAKSLHELPVPADAKTVTLIHGFKPVFDDPNLLERFLSNLNYSRDLLRDSHPYPMILLMDPDHLPILERGAPDFFSVHSGYYRFLDQDRSGKGFLLDLARAKGLTEADPMHFEGSDSLGARQLPLTESFGISEMAGLEDPQISQRESRRLFHHYRQLLSQSPLPQTVEEMKPEMIAIQYGCKAGLFEEAFTIYRDRMQRDSAYLSLTLGAHTTALEVMSNFFQMPYSEPHSELPKKIRPECLIHAGFELQWVGRFSESLAPFELNLTEEKASEQWFGAFSNLRCLGESLLALGEIRRVAALVDGHAGLVRTLRPWKTWSGELLARALHYGGEWKSAERQFQQLQDVDGAHYLLEGTEYHISEFLIDLGEYPQAEKRIQLTLSRGARYLSDLNIVLLELALIHARSYMVHTPEEWGELKTAADKTMTGLKRHGTFADCAAGHLVRAKLARRDRRFDDAQRDLVELWDRVEFGGMRLMEVEYHLQSALLQRDLGAGEAARKHLRQARDLAEVVGYHRRKQELADLAKSLGRP